MNITLLSDTHGHLDDRVLKHVQGSDEIWHAGDIGNLAVTDQLKKIAKCRAVYGNIDGQDVRSEWPLNQNFKAGGLNIWMTHIGGRPPAYAKGVLPELKQTRPDVFVCGHSHILLIQSVQSWGGLHLNPGAAGVHGFHQTCTLIKFIIESKQILDMRVIEWQR